MAEAGLQRFVGKRAVVTGAARGIGAAIAERLASEGAEVISVDRLPAPRHRAFAVREAELDLTEPDAAARIAGLLSGPFDFLVNNAGIGGSRPVADTADADWDRILLTNLTSVFRLCRDLTPLLRRPGSRIVNIASVFGLTGFPGAAAYGVAKAGVAQLTRQLAVDLAPAGILCNAVAPGIIETEMTQRRIAEDGWYRSVMCEATPVRRNGRPADIAGAVAFLCSEDAAFIAGQVLAVDGGWLESKYLPYD